MPLVLILTSSILYNPPVGMLIHWFFQFIHFLIHLLIQSTICPHTYSSMMSWYFTPCTCDVMYSLHGAHIHPFALSLGHIYSPYIHLFLQSIDSITHLVNTYLCSQPVHIYFHNLNHYLSFTPELMIFLFSVKKVKMIWLIYHCMEKSEHLLDYGKVVIF